MSSADQDSSTCSKGSDAEWLTLFIEQHDTVALQRLIEKHSRLLMSVCWQILQNHADAEDAFQATVVQLVKDAASIRNRNYVSTWLYSVAQRESIKIFRRQKREPIQLIKEPSDMRTSHVDISQDQLDELAMLHDELDRLPEKYRGPLVLCYLEGKSRQEAARELDVTVSSIKASLASGRNQLQKKLLKRGIVFSSVLATWNVSQLEAGLSVSTTLVQHAIQSGVAQVSTVTTGTTSLSTSMTGSKGLLTKGTTWMTVSTGKKAIVGSIGILLLLGSGIMVLPQFTNTPELNRHIDLNTSQTDEPFVLTQELNKLIEQIKENEKLYENIEVEMHEKREMSGKFKDPVEGSSFEIDQPVALKGTVATELESLPFDLRKGTRLPYLKSLNREIIQVSQQGRNRITGKGELIYSEFYFERGHYYQVFKKYDWNQNPNLAEETKGMPQNEAPSHHPPISNINPYNLLFSEVPEGTIPFSTLLTGGEELINVLMQMKSNQITPPPVVNYRSKIIKPDTFSGENVLIIEMLSEAESEPKEPYTQRHTIYLAADKNYIPIKWEVVRISRPLDQTIYEVKSWIEPKPGIWYPSQTEVSYQKNGESARPISTATYQVHSLSPNYPEEFFVPKDNHPVDAELPPPPNLPQ